ncbi:hypothetical protein FRC07_015020 [Ceratobasidium sp. 392]|nr:hypothetical protein FRC07_015020 [Ceratobasidium sp. 392]
MTTHKSKKAKGKARARPTPSRSPTPVTLTPPPGPSRRGRPPGAGNYSNAELRLLLKVLRKYKPRSNGDWSQEVERRYNAGVPKHRHRRAENLRARFNRLVRKPKPTGDPEVNELHEEALLINDELEALEHTHVLDDPPTPAETIDISSSECDSMDVDDVPVPIPAPSAPSSSRKRKAEPSAAFRAVARKVGSSSRPAQSQNFLDAATSQIASVFNPANEDRLASRQRDDITIITLNDTIRDLQAELSQERERRFTLERQLRDEETRRLVAAQVQQQLQQRLQTHRVSPSFDPPRSNPHPSTAGEAHPSWMPGPPPERSDMSGSGSYGWDY